MRSIPPAQNRSIKMRENSIIWKNTRSPEWREIYKISVYMGNMTFLPNSCVLSINGEELKQVSGSHLKG
jgi:hypothetical protein